MSDLGPVLGKKIFKIFPKFFLNSESRKSFFKTKFFRLQESKKRGKSREKTRKFSKFIRFKLFESSEVEFLGALQNSFFLKKTLVGIIHSSKMSDYTQQMYNKSREIRKIVVIHRRMLDKVVLSTKA